MATKGIAAGFALLLGGIVALWAWVKLRQHQFWAEVCNGTDQPLREVTVVVGPTPEPARPSLAPGECTTFSFSRRGPVGAKGTYRVTHRMPAGWTNTIGGCGYFSLGLPPQIAPRPEHIKIVPEGKHFQVECGKVGPSGASSGIKTDNGMDRPKTPAEPKPLDPIAEIDRGCDAIDAEKGLPVRLFGYVAPDPMKWGRWREFKDAKQLQAVESDVPETAELRRVDALGSLVAMFMTSRSGDWATFVQYCYRTDGTLARSNATLNTFLTGDDVDEGVTRERIRWFDSSGDQLKVATEVRGLKSKRRQPKRQFMKNDEPIYRRLSALPFAVLIGKKQP